MALPIASQPTGSTSLMARLKDSVAGLETLTRTPALRRALPSILVLGMTGLAVGLWLMLREPATTPIYPGMDDADKALVMEALTGAGIEAAVDGSTGQIVVPADAYHTAVMALAAQGLPRSAPNGADLVSNLPMGESRSVEAVQLRQAQELDLARSITEIMGINGARVHLALAERSAFLRDNQPPRASVFLQLAPGRVLDAAQTEAIINLVSSSVPGMARQDVTVVDQMGRLLSQGSSDPAMMASDQQMQRRLQMETIYRQRIEALLAPIVGPDNLSVQVTMDMDFTRKEITEERVDPKGSALLSEQTQVSENSTGSARGIPGAVSNTPPADPTLSSTGPAAQGAAAATSAAANTAAAAGAAPAAGSEGSNRSEGVTRNYQVSKSIQTTQPATAQIVKVSAAIVVRAKPAEEGADPAAPLLPPALQADLENLTKSAIGFDAARGDSITVLAQPFADVIENATPATSNLDWLPEVLRQLGLLAGLAIIALGIVRPLLSRMMSAADPVRAEAADTGVSSVEVGEGDSLDMVQARLDARRQKLAEAALGATASREEKFAVLRQIAADDPARIANVLQRMMKSEQDQYL
jgi:flagellar M-ring protein FliF